MHLTLDGVDLFYTDHGGAGTPLVLVHAAAGTSACWVYQVPAFTTAGFRVVTFDLRNFGQSTAQPGHETESTIAEDLHALVSHLRLPPFFLVGTAYGGFGALEFAADHPELLRGFVLSTSFGGLTDPEYSAMRAVYVPADLAARPTVEKELGATYRKTDPDGVQRFLEMEHESYRGDGARQPFGRPMTLERVATVSVPTLVISADEDVYAPPPVMGAIADRIPNARFEIVSGAGHSAYWEQPEAWNQLILDFAAAH
jgi:pimeloyl-ACP methyl ester carboxylesterase